MELEDIEQIVTAGSLEMEMDVDIAPSPPFLSPNIFSPDDTTPFLFSLSKNVISMLFLYYFHVILDVVHHLSIKGFRSTRLDSYYLQKKIL